MYNCLKVKVPVEQDGGEIKDMTDITHIMVFLWQHGNRMKMEFFSELHLEQIADIC